MQHIAIMRKSWGLTSKFLSREKTIESRWYKNRYSPWDRIKQGDTIYFKDSGEPIKIKAEVDKVLQFSDLDQNKVREILDKYHKEDGIEDSEKEKYFQLFKDKKFCLLIFLKNVEKVELFNITKKGFGAMSSWICIDDIEKLKVG